MYQFINDLNVADYMTTSYSGRPTAITISAWIRQDGAGDPPCRIITGEATGSLWAFMLGSTTSTQGALEWYAAWDGNDVYTQESAISSYDGTIRHVLVTYDGTAAGNDGVLYKSGSAVGVTVASESTGNLDATTGAWVIGGRASDQARGCVMHIGEVAIFDRILTAGQITQLAAGKSPMDTGNVGANPVWYHRMKDHISDASNAIIGTLTNGSGSNAATLQSGTNPTVDDPPSGGTNVSLMEISG